MFQFELTLEQWAAKDAIRFTDLKPVLSAMSKAYDMKVPPLETWGKVRSLTLNCLKNHPLVEADDPFVVLGTLINTRAFCGEFEGDSIDDSKYLEIREAAENLLVHAEAWNSSPEKDWMVAALNADIAVTDLRRIGRGYIEPNYQDVAEKLSTFLEQIWLAQDVSQSISDSFQEATEKFAPRVLSWMLEATLKTPNNEETLGKILDNVQTALESAEGDSNSATRNAYYSGVSSIAESLLDHAANAVDETQKTRLIILTDRAISYLEKMSSTFEKGSYWDRDLAALKQKREAFK